MVTAHSLDWQTLDGSDGNLSQLPLAPDPESGDYAHTTKKT